MVNLLTHEQIEDLVLNVCGSNKIKFWKGDKLQICCPIHGESNPSCSINAYWLPDDSNEVIQTFHCFSCGKSGRIPKMLYLSRQDLFKNELEAEKYIENRYVISYAHKVWNNPIVKIKRYEDLYQTNLQDNRKVKPFYTLAPFKSGKETFKYFFNRGFTKEEMKEYMIGRDLELHTVTIPVFYENGELAGVIGRFLPKYCSGYNERYHIYDFSKGNLLYPLDKLEVKNSEIILVESQLDAILMRRWGIKNVLATMGGTLSRVQANIVASLCEKVILLFDNDHGGELAQEKAEMLLKNKVRVKKVIYPTEGGKDPQEWGENLTRKIISTAGTILVKRI